MNIKEEVLKYKPELIEKITKLVSYDTVLKGSEEGYPFGKKTAECLEDALSMCREYGFETVNLDNYVGYGEIGSGEQLIGVLAHLDVVPTGEGWLSDPFKAEIRDGKLYGRGVSDDKGAAVCSMLALKIVKELRPDMNKRIRLILGCNEETGSRCLEYYVKKEGHVDYGFTPDGAFPGCHGEKGAMKAIIRLHSDYIKAIEGGVAPNVVPNKVTLSVDPKDNLDSTLLKEYFDQHNISYQCEEENGLWKLVVHGVAAHASTPDLGVNAVSHAICALYHANVKDQFIQYYMDKIETSTHGDSMDLHLSDEYGDLTFNVGQVYLKDGMIECVIDIRFPVTEKSERILAGLKASNINGYDGTLQITSVSEPLFYPIDSPLVSLLASAYEEVTGDHENKPFTMGGGTYAHGINNTIAFGCAFPNGDNHIHDANEFVIVDELLLQVEIYVNALLKLIDQ